jgi:hypothetical protein
VARAHAPRQPPYYARRWRSSGPQPLAASSTRWYTREISPPTTAHRRAREGRVEEGRGGAEGVEHGDLEGLLMEQGLCHPPWGHTLRGCDDDGITC